MAQGFWELCRFPRVDEPTQGLQVVGFFLEQRCFFSFIDQRYLKTGNNGGDRDGDTPEASRTGGLSGSRGRHHACWRDVTQDNAEGHVCPGRVPGLAVLGLSPGSQSVRGPGDTASAHTPEAWGDAFVSPSLLCTRPQHRRTTVTLHSYSCQASGATAPEDMLGNAGPSGSGNLDSSSFWWATAPGLPTFPCAGVHWKRDGVARVCHCPGGSEVTRTSW